jgi:hypothetical protein
MARDFHHDAAHQQMGELNSRIERLKAQLSTVQSEVLMLGYEINIAV